jgi:hypothetical protein
LSFFKEISPIERVQGKFIKYALRSLGWADPLNLPPYENRCRLIHLDTLAERRNKACVMFVFDVLSGKIDAPPILAEIRLNVPSYRTRSSEFCHIDFHRKNYGKNEPITNAVRKFNEKNNFFLILVLQETHF